MFYLYNPAQVSKVEWKNRFTDLGQKMQRLICVYPESLFHHKALLKRLQKDQRVSRLFNSNLTHVQQYLFMELKIEPTSKVQVWYDDHRLTRITKLNEDEELVPPPPFTVLYFQVHTISFYYSGKYAPDEPIKSIKAQYQDEPQISFEGTEDTILREFCNFILTHDPDIVISTEQHYRSTGIIQYLFARMNELGIDGTLGRSDSTNNIEGRIYLDDNSHLVEIIKPDFPFFH
jgi:DNA polymerase elongation subunit (family B)